ncbi:elongation of very long chain fatty acids protein AAEL008004-like [Condylostylus longicornis]|uniref:elongation of very long chain fatty acids protein AAEL008004-like n=1 Tax=Condylostylus longicornis TaxID=2530218 RepID=UPI00244DAC1B|nr:elongation of very long chain fatty acids protein AAEL008004-like [Condylostylus longicornis]
MVYLIKQAFNLISYYEQKKDMRTDHYLFLGSPLKTIAILALYYYFVKNLGPRLMKDRKPFQLKGVLMVYNIIQVVANAILSILSIYAFFSNPDRKLRCLLSDYSNTDIAMFEANLTYAYYLLKLSDLLDTIFFVLRKKNNQITFLHTYHHMCMIVGTYATAKWLPGGHMGIVGILNSFVHILMYSYYFIASMKPELSKSIWWKKYITQAQILQFSILFVHFSHPLLFGDCKYPKFWMIFGFVQNTFMLILFSDFYYRTYICKNNSKTKSNKIKNINENNNHIGNKVK